MKPQLPMASSETKPCLTGNDAVLFAIDHGLRVVVSGTLILDPRDDMDSQDVVQLIFDGYGEELTVEDPTLRKELN